MNDSTNEQPKPIITKEQHDALTAVKKQCSAELILEMWYRGQRTSETTMLTHVGFTGGILARCLYDPRGWDVKKPDHRITVDDHIRSMLRRVYKDDLAAEGNSIVEQELRQEGFDAAMKALGITGYQ